MNLMKSHVFGGNRGFAVLVAVVVVVVMSHTPVLAEQEYRVPRWEPHDFAFRGEARVANPFLVESSAMVRGPDGSELVVPGFYDGGGTWKVRISPTIEGRWSIVTRSDQQHSRWRQTILSQRAQRTWPVVNVEFGYEHGPQGLEDKTYGVVQSPEEVCRRAWEVYMAGGYGVYYYTYTAWDVIRPEDVPPGYAYFRNLRDFFEGTRYWRMEPTEGLVSNGYCLADRGREYVVFLNRAEPFTLELEQLRQPLVAEWFQPLTGGRRPAGQLKEGIVRLEPPVEWGTGPVALHALAAQR